MCNMCICRNFWKDWVEMWKLWGVSVCMPAWVKNVKNSTDPYDTGPKGLSLSRGKVISSLWKNGPKRVVLCFLLRNSCNVEC